MSSRRSELWTRAGLWSLAAAALFTGLPAALFGHTFFDHFPFIAHWVDRLPPFNEHLTSDVGGMYLGFAALFAWAALRPRRELIVPVCLGWALTQVLHLAFHLAHLDALPTADAIAQTVALASLVLLPLFVARVAPASR